MFCNLVGWPLREWRYTLGTSFQAKLEAFKRRCQFTFLHGELLFEVGLIDAYERV